MNDDLERFAHSLVQEVTASADANSTSTHDAFAELVLDDLEVAGHIEDWFVAYWRSHGVEVSGYAWNHGLSTLDLFLVQFRQQPLVVKVGVTEVRALARRAASYVNKVRRGLKEQIDDSIEAHDMCVAIEDILAKRPAAIRIFLITNDSSTIRNIESTEDEAGIPVTYEIWDLTRLHRLATSGVLHEPIAVTLDPPLPYLSTPKTDQNYSVLLTIIRGDVLGAIYREYGTRLLQLNVRTFLQLRGAVNRGIRETLIHTPERFLAYNNGISATASRVALGQLANGGQGISEIFDFQIVNGGQTTAAIHSSLMRDEADLSQVYIQMKLTVVEPQHRDEIVPEISRFSNTQNKVTVVDFSSNHPYHVELEKVSRTLWAPAAEGTGQETKWFYERARGQYAEALSRERTPARQRAFKVQFPPKQKFVKTDVAKWEHAWNQKPALVSRGAEKNFRAFMAELGDAVPTSDISFVKRLLAKGILFRSTERIVTDQQFGGYRANIVAYTVAKLAHETAQRIDLDRIWRDQGVSDALSRAIAEISVLVHKVIMDPPLGTAHVGEWTKKDACWARVAGVEWSVPRDLESELVDTSYVRRTKLEEQKAGMSPEDEGALARVTAVAADSWFELARWARETQNLQGWQRTLAYSLGRVLARGNEPTLKQARQGDRILKEARELGFRCD